MGRMARRKRWSNWVGLHITGMGMSYVLLLTAFYVDNGKSLPLWRTLPSIAYWLAPAAVGIPLIVRALLWHPLAQHKDPFYIGRGGIEPARGLSDQAGAFGSFGRRSNSNGRPATGGELNIANRRCAA